MGMMLIILLASASLTLGERNAVESTLNTELALLSKQSADLSEKAKMLANKIKGLSDRSVEEGQASKAAIKNVHEHEVGGVTCESRTFNHILVSYSTDNMEIKKFFSGSISCTCPKIDGSYPVVNAGTTNTRQQSSKCCQSFTGSYIRPDGNGNEGYTSNKCGVNLMANQANKDKTCTVNCVDVCSGQQNNPTRAGCD